jgi:adenylate kinase
VNLILLGPPGAGKGTHAQNLVENFNYYHFSTGNLLREEVKKKNILGEKIFSLISKGDFVSDEIVNEILINTVSNDLYKNKIIFDGYPRNLKQANNLNKIFEKKNLLIGSIIYLKVSKEIIEQRILSRVICEKCNKIFNELINHEEIKKHECGEKYLKKRLDDDKDVIQKRFDTYMNETKPVLDFYANQTNFFEIDASIEIDEITRKIEEIIKV